jgi:hypothetical protein
MRRRDLFILPILPILGAAAMPIFPDAFGDMRRDFRGKRRAILPFGQSSRTTVTGFSGGTTQAATLRRPMASPSMIYRSRVVLQLFSESGAGSTADPYVSALFPSPLRYQAGSKAGYVKALTGLPVRDCHTW